MTDAGETLRRDLSLRFGNDTDDLLADVNGQTPEFWRQLAARGSCRHFREEPVSRELIETICALALASPTKSDLQQRDIIIIDEPVLRGQINAKLASGPLGQEWIANAPAMLIFCGNNRRQRLLHEWRGKPFANDHLDAFFNAAVDAGIAMTAFMLAAEAAGLGCTPVSAVRNHAEAISELMELPEHVFPVTGLGLGWPKFPEPRIAMRLPLSMTVHRNRFSEDRVRQKIDAYDARRHAAQPMSKQRAVDRFGDAENYTWSEDKARQYAGKEREDWGAYVRKRGFNLD